MLINSDGAIPTPSTLREPERELLDSTGGREVVWAGRAATALYYAYRAVVESQPPVEQPEVILPAICCATPANVAYLAGMTPRFADVDPTTGLMSAEATSARLTSRTRAIVVVHLYGQTVDMAPYRDICQRHRLLLIEDAAQAQGARLPNSNMVGSEGDFCIYSFNPTKLLECGGGALLVRTPHLANLVEDVIKNHPLPPLPSREILRQLSASYRDLHHSLVALMRLNPELNVERVFKLVRPKYDWLLLRPMTDPNVLAEHWQRLPSIIARRRTLAARYEELLSVGPWKLLCGWRKSGVCWRFSLLLNSPESLIEISEAVRQDGFHVSNLYWPLQTLFASEDECPNSLLFSRRIVNLWVDDSVSLETATQCCQSICSCTRQS